eukprot:gnl/TRDRNA2_/TRDRNA2_55685_c0_seq1.p1 gnl/TRDRNA2_/TRDRNA2_55685_c0~~gnl/TRDRNA2_/TRDRNA2_55685_c0_seq1.p1  ORF type:complete len:132 (-),score=32.80 gnl/TRDRNA2_/TRDRNA2_55685_c0_seq1:88-483(-)
MSLTKLAPSVESLQARFKQLVADNLVHRQLAVWEPKGAGDDIAIEDLHRRGELLRKEHGEMEEDISSEELQRRSEALLDDIAAIWKEQTNQMRRRPKMLREILHRHFTTFWQECLRRERLAEPAAKKRRRA